MAHDLDTALRRLVSAFTRCPTRSGMLTYRAPEPVPVPLEVGPVLTEYYAKLRFDGRPMLGGAFSQFLFGPDQLQGAQNGWHIITDRHGRQLVNPTWPASWVVIADRHGDAIFVDTATDLGATYMSIQQENRRVASSLASYLACLAACVAMEVERFPDGAQDDDFNYVAAFLAEVERVAGEHLSPDDRAGFVHFFFE
jgi:hypothetical protein